MTRECLPFSLMNLGNSLTIRESQALSLGVAYVCMCAFAIGVGCCFFLYHGFPRTYQRKKD